MEPAPRYCPPPSPGPGHQTRWRHLDQARYLGWEEGYGPGPFEVVGVVDHTLEDIPRGLILRTRRGEREINETWLTLEAAPPG